MNYTLFMNMQFEVVITFNLKKKIKSINKDHRRFILKAFQKIKKMGLNALKILKAYENYLLCEIKFKKPPYRLYVIVDQKEKTFFLVEWEHKKNQKRILDILSKSLKNGIKKIIEY